MSKVYSVGEEIHVSCPTCGGYVDIGFGDNCFRCGKSILEDEKIRSNPAVADHFRHSHKNNRP
jgi:endogenous inhibitor of DNA gyrase (YacG/DUF329 family)